MRCLVVILSVVACARVAVATVGASCLVSEEFFLRHNVSSADENDEPGPICGGQCCGRGRELKLRASLSRAVQTSASTKWTAELLISTKESLQNHLIGLAWQSQNKTATLFTQLYRGQAAKTTQPLSSLYDDIRFVIRPDLVRTYKADPLSATPPKDLKKSTTNFFREIFPVAFHNVLKLNSKQFTPAYEMCLKDAYDNVQPFGDVPTKMGQSLSRSVDAARVLLQMLSVGAETLEAAQKVLADGSEACTKDLLRVAGCAKCSGYVVPPCRDFCLNVVRGCIGSLLADMDGPWAGYVEGVERLTKVDADLALREIESKVSRAIMYALETRAISENKVREECGPPSTIESASPLSSYPTPGSIRRENLRAPPPDTELLQFTATLASTKRLFTRLSDKLCEQRDFSDEEATNCWNGEAIDVYKKPLVSSASIADQKYNPEIIGGSPQDPRVVGLAYRLQQARQLLVQYSGVNDAHAEAFMQGDEAGEEGSGSGRSYPEDYDSEGSGDNGSGDGHDGQSRTYINESPPDSSTPRTSASGSLHPAPLAALFAIVYVALTT